MKQIGYIYKYNSNEKKGILVFGTEKINLPIKFHDNDCCTSVHTGQLVYFELNENKATCIEHASLANFDKKILDNILTEKDSDTSDWYYKHTHISYECLDNIVYDNNSKEASNGCCLDCFGGDDFLLEDIDLAEILFNQQNAIYLKKQLPETIDELYKCFGRYKHNKRKDSIVIDITDLSLWVDDNVFQHEYFGENIEEIKYLYEVFVQKKRFNIKENAIIPSKENNCISNSWKRLLARLSSIDLKSVIQITPLLQPALPIKFCKENIDILFDSYGMPSVLICKKYCFEKINKICTASEYKQWSQNLYQYNHCKIKHLKNEGAHMCMMGKKHLKELEQLLNTRYYIIVKKNIVKQFSLLIKQTKDNPLKKIRFTQKKVLAIGTFLDVYNIFPKIFLEYGSCEILLKVFYDMEQDCQHLLNDTLRSLINNSVIEGARNEEVTPSILNEQIEILAAWIDSKTLLYVKNIVNEKFANSKTLDELGYAYKYGFISRVQYYKKFKELTCNFNICQFMDIISNNLNNKFPLIIQWYIICTIIKIFDFNNLSELDNVKQINGNINSIRDLLKWFHEQVKFRRIDKYILNKAEKKILNALNDNEKWELFEAGLVTTPGGKCIRKQLNRLYKGQNNVKELYKKDCFQEIMSKDILNDIDLKTKIFIINHLNQYYQQVLINKCTGFVKLYLWLQNPSEDIEWNLIKTYFTQLSEKDQIKLFRYIFFLIAKQKFVLTVDELFDLFVKSENKACCALCGIMYFLKKKLNQSNEPISSYELGKVIGLGVYNRLNFIYMAKELFYPCSGYLTLTNLQCDTEYQSYNGVLTLNKQEENMYYVISFYDFPVDAFGYEIEWLDEGCITEAKEVLEHNLKTEMLNRKYYIPLSEEIELKKYVMAYNIDDKCSLLDSNQNTYKPLYTNILKCYEKCDNFICRCGNFSDVDPYNGIPYYWCNKQICVRRCHYITPLKWENYRFADFLYILLKQNRAKVDLIWEITSEVSNFINEYAHNVEKVYVDNNIEERNIISNLLQESEEIGVWTAESTTVKDIIDDDNIDIENYNQEIVDYEESTYEKYGGSYAQDEMGYSDDDIDTIFDGDPMAYWNID